MTHVPWMGSKAYLNTIFQAADATVQRDIIDPVGLPEQPREFYRAYNGAHLFSDNFSVYGFFPEEYLLERLKKFYPYNILSINQEYVRNPQAWDIFLVGSYGYDRSEVFVEKATGIIRCGVGKDLRKRRAVWPSFDIWLTEEIKRLSNFFDVDGRCRVSPEELLPNGPFDEYLVN